MMDVLIKFNVFVFAAICVMPLVLVVGLKMCNDKKPEGDSVVRYPTMIVSSGTETFIVQEVLGSIDASGNLRAIIVKNPNSGMEDFAIVMPGFDVVVGEEVSVTIMTLQKDKEHFEALFFVCGEQKLETPPNYAF